MSAFKVQPKHGLLLGWVEKVVKLRRREEQSASKSDPAAKLSAASPRSAAPRLAADSMS